MRIYICDHIFKFILYFIQVDGMVFQFWTWLPNTTVVGQGREVFSKPDTDTDPSSKETKLSTSAEKDSKWILFETTFRLFTIYFRQYFEETTVATVRRVGDGQIQNRRFDQKIEHYIWYPEAFWVNSDFCN